MDGVLGHPMTSPEYVRQVLLPAVRRGAVSAGRPPGQVNVSTSLIVQVSPDRELARREAALQLGFYATTRTYRPVLELHGFQDRIEPLRRAYVRRDVAMMTSIALPMVDSLAIAGSAGYCRERVRAYDGLVDRIILGGAWVGASAERIEENYAAIVRAFGRYSGGSSG